jgi:hypothetical protein
MPRILMHMTMLAVLLAALGWRPPLAAAAGMAYCEIWADRVAAVSQAVREQPAIRQSVRDRFFYECLNMDEEPPLPDAARNLFIDPSGSPFRSLDYPPVASAPGARPLPGQADPEPFAAPAQPEEPLAQGDADEGEGAAGAEDDGQGRGSGHPRGSPEWTAFCQKYYPRSFDPQTGTVVPVKLGKRVPCR